MGDKVVGDSGLPREQMPPPSGQTPESQISQLLKLTEGISFQQAETEAVKGLPGIADLIAEGMTPVQAISEMQKAGEVAMSNPDLPKPDQAMVSLYLRRLAALSFQLMRERGEPVPEGAIPIGKAFHTGSTVGNSFLTGSMMFELFKILTDIARLESKIAFDTAQMKINMSRTLISVVKQIAQLIIDLGELAAKKCILEATRAIAEGAMAIAQCVTAAVELFVSASWKDTKAKKFETDRAEELKKQDFEAFNSGHPEQMKYFAPPKAPQPPPPPVAAGGAASASAPAPAPPTPLTSPNQLTTLKDLDAFKNATQPNAEQRLKIDSEVTWKMQQTSTIINQAFLAISKTAEAVTKFIEAGYVKEEASDRAAQTALEQLKDMLNKSTQDLGSDYQAIRSSIEALLKALSEIMHVISTIGQGQG